MSLYFLVILFPGTASCDDKWSVPVIEVTGQAVVTASPNQASITFMVENTDTRAETALRKNSDITARVMSTLKKTAGKDATVSTPTFTIQPVYDRDMQDDAGKFTPRGFTVSNALLVKTQRVDRLGALIDTAVTAGATRVDSLIFSRDDKDQLQKQASAKALENAVDCAKRLAKTAGLSVKRIKYIQYLPNNTESNPEVALRAEGATPVPVSPGQLTFESFVTVVYEIGQ